jgi:integrase
MRLQRKSTVTVYTRHAGTCPHKSDESFPRCGCSKWMRWSRDGHQRRQAAGTRTWGVAEKAAGELQRRLDSGEVAPPPAASATPTIAAWAETFITNKQTKGVTPATERKVRYHVGLFEQFMSARSKFFPADITIPDCVAFRASWSSWKSSVTKAKAQQNIRGFVKLMGRGDLLTVFDTIIKTKADKARLAPKPFTEAELKRLLAQVPVTFPDKVKAARVTALIHLMAGTGIAIVDAVTLEIASLEGGRLSIERKKTGKTVQQRLDPALHKELLAVTNGNPKYVFWNGTSLPTSATTNWQTDLRKVMIDAGCYIHGNLSHRLRDTAVDFWLGAGCSMTEIAALLGDSPLVVDLHYRDWASKRMEERLAKLPVRTW